MDNKGSTSSSGSGSYLEQTYNNFGSAIFPTFSFHIVQKNYRITGSLVVTAVTGVPSVQVTVGWTESYTGNVYTDIVPLLRSDGTTVASAGTIANHTFVWFGNPKSGTSIAVNTVIAGTVTYDFAVMMEGFVP